MERDVWHPLAIAAGEAGQGPQRAADPAAALRDCLAKNYERLHTRLSRRLGCAEQASDCLHDAWVRLHDLGVSGEVQRPEAYVYRVARNLAMNCLRTPSERLRADDDGEALALLVDEAPGPQAVAEERMRARAFLRAFARLPRRQQAVLEAFLEGLTRQEVAERYGLSLRGVDTALRRALAQCAA